MSTRLMILKSWHGARRRADIDGAVKLTAASFAGFALEAAEGDVEMARKFVPAELEVFWARVVNALDEVAAEESSPLAAVAAGRR